jgi:hypothetical protein
MDIDSNFPTEVQTIDDVPEPLRLALKDSIPPYEQVRLIIYSPAFLILDDVPVLPPAVLAPATVMAVLKDGWLVATEEEDRVSVEKSTFDETLGLELTSILLSGELKIFFASVGRPYLATIPFNTVREELYLEAINLILNGIDHSPSFQPLIDDRPEPILEAWPMKFRVDAERYQPASQRLITATRWDAVTGGFERNLFPAGALLVTAPWCQSRNNSQPRDQAAFRNLAALSPISRWLGCQTFILATTDVSACLLSSCERLTAPRSWKSFSHPVARKQ